jgi:hypothetical protein
MSINLTANKANTDTETRLWAPQSLDEQPVIIRATMSNGFHHPARNGFGLFGTLNSDDAADSAHEVIWGC